MQCIKYQAVHIPTWYCMIRVSLPIPIAATHPQCRLQRLPTTFRVAAPGRLILHSWGRPPLPLAVQLRRRLPRCPPKTEFAVVHGYRPELPLRQVAGCKLLPPSGGSSFTPGAASPPSAPPTTPSPSPASAND
jgi:hypothetical protein